MCKIAEKSHKKFQLKFRVGVVQRQRKKWLNFGGNLDSLSILDQDPEPQPLSSPLCSPSILTEVWDLWLIPVTIINVIYITPKLPCICVFLLYCFDQNRALCNWMLLSAKWVSLLKCLILSRSFIRFHKRDRWTDHITATSVTIPKMTKNWNKPDRNITPVLNCL